MEVVTYVLPPAPGGEQQPLSERSLRFMRGHPKMFGTFQIVMGVVILSFGIAMVGYETGLGVFTGSFVWGTVTYIAAGCMAVAAENLLSIHLMKATLGLNILAAIASGVCIVLYVLDSIIWSPPHGDRYPGYTIVLALFHCLVFVVSIIVAAFTCNATCSCCAKIGSYH